jgi:tripartite-type tricarboxylate transporter receptor subunit TctC
MLIRTVVQPISASIGQPVVIDYRAGAGGNIGMEFAAKAAPDGYTLVVGALAQQVLNPLIDPKLAYDPDRDFVPIVLLARFPYVLVAHPSVPARSSRELIDLLKASPGKYNYGSHGNGTTSHVAAELFKSTVGVQITHVPYKSDAAAVTDLLGGQVQLMFNVASSVWRHIEAGKLRGIATASAQRVPSIPDLATFEEQGGPKLAAETWYSLLAPVGTPRPILERLNAEVNKVLANPATRATLAQSSAIPAGGTMAEVRSFIEAEKVKWKPIVAASGAKVD